MQNIDNNLPLSPRVSNSARLNNDSSPTYFGQEKIIYSQNTNNEALTSFLAENNIHLNNVLTEKNNSDIEGDVSDAPGSETETETIKHYSLLETSAYSY